ncbi:hypothetical protein CHUAL_010988 [Chamberlinius hualienensis]
MKKSAVTMITQARHGICFVLVLMTIVFTFIYVPITHHTYLVDRPKQISKEKNDESISDTTKMSSDSKWQIFTDDKLARKLQKTIRVLCWIAVTESTLEKAELINQTWGQRCTKILFIGDKTTRNISGVISLDVADGRSQLWPKTRAAFQYIFDNHIDDADWFLKADTDTYVIMENLRYLLSTKASTEPHYLGCLIHLYVPSGYNSGGAGYLLNRLALEKLVSKGYDNKRCFKGYMEDEDVSLGYCMHSLKIKPTDTTDVSDKSRFFPFEPYDHVSSDPPGSNNWYWNFANKPGKKSMNCCSDTMISFHYVPKNVMLTMELLLYHSKVFGVSQTYIEKY